MTKPTPAQIAAAMGAYGVVLSQAHLDGDVSPNDLRNAMSAALTTAAEVGEAIKAREHLAALENVKAITIERCAQMADSYTKGGEELGTSGIHIKIAAAIRALKDKP